MNYYAPTRFMALLKRTEEGSHKAPCSKPGLRFEEGKGEVRKKSLNELLKEV